MIPAITAQTAPVKPVQLSPAATDQRITQTQAAEGARASIGERGAANIRSETVNAIRAAEQAAVAPRLRTGETAENTDRDPPTVDAPTGPPPAFKESPLERQARVAFDPPEPESLPEIPAPSVEVDEAAPDDAETNKAPAAAQPVEPPPTRTERAEASFSETRSLAKPPEPQTLDLSA